MPTCRFFFDLGDETDGKSKPEYYVTIFSCEEQPVRTLRETAKALMLYFTERSTRLAPDPYFVTMFWPPSPDTLASENVPSGSTFVISS